MTTQIPAAFFSYSRDDSEFALRLAGDLKAAGAAVWLDQLDISPGQEWDNAIEEALAQCPRMLLILSPSSVKSRNVRNEIARALDEKKSIIPVFHLDCIVPLQLARVQFIDFRTDYSRGLKGLLKTLGVEQPPEPRTPAAPPESQPIGAVVDERKRAADQARQEEARRLAGAEEARLEQHERERQEQERRRAPISPAPPSPVPGSPAWMKIGLAVCGVLIVALVSYLAFRPKQPDREIQTPEVKGESSNPPTTAADKPSTSNVASPPVDTRPSKQTSEPVSTEWVKQFLSAGEGPSVGALRPYYDDTVSPYFGPRTATWGDIAKDKQSYFDRFPTIHYLLVGEPTYSGLQEGQAILEFDLKYSATRKDGQVMEGTEHLALNLRSVDGQWKITGIRERKLNQ